MDAQEHTPDEAPDRDENPLPVAKPVPTQPTVKPVASSIPPPPQGELAAQPAQQQAQQEAPRILKPLLVRVIEDDELSTFERKTVHFDYWGIVVGILSLAAACVAADMVYQQFKEMSAQTELLSRGAKQARVDSAASGTATAQQLGIMQQQLTQQSKTMQLDQRAWLGVQGVHLHIPYDSKHLAVTVELINTGKTPAIIEAIDAKIGESYAPFTSVRWFMNEHLKGQDAPPNSIQPLTLGEGDSMDIGEDRFKLMQERKMRHDMYAIVHYRDAFGKRHTTEICIALTGKQEDLGPGNPFPLCSPNRMK